MVRHFPLLALATGSEVQDWRAFEDFLRQQPGTFLDHLETAREGGLRGVFAKRDFQDGDLVLKIPHHLCLQTPSRDDAGDTARDLAWKLLEERQRGAASPFQPYLQLLPPLPSLHPLATQPPPKLRGALKRYYGEAQDRFSVPGSDSKDFRWALGMVWTRAFAFGKSLAMVPYLDLFNHWIPQHRDDPLWNCRLQEWPEAIGLVADRDIRTGEELNHLYSEASDAQLLVQHGIPPNTPSANPFNEAILEVELSEDLRHEAQRAGFGESFQLPEEVGSLQQLAALVAKECSTEPRELEQRLLCNWLQEGEMKLKRCLEEELPATPALAKALKDIITEEAALLRRLRVQLPVRATTVL